MQSHARSPDPIAAMALSTPNLGSLDLRAQGVAQMQQSSSLPTLPLPRKTTGEVAPSSLATSSLATASTTMIDPKRVTSTPALSPRKEPLKKAAKRKARAQSMSFTGTRKRTRTRTHTHPMLILAPTACVQIRRSSWR
jgi:hypothetical protein